MSLPSLSPTEPEVESSPDAQEGGLDAAKPERAEGAERTEGAKALWPARQNLPPACATAPPSGKEDQSSSGEVGTQESLASEPPQGEEGKAEEKAAGESEDTAAVESDQEEEHLVPLSPMIPFISCSICKGYLIDATTITECLHAFCKSCIVKHFEHSNRCPKCNITVHEAKPHNSLRMDPQLQNIVYKLVAGLEEKEKKQRREFYKENCPGTPKPAAVPQPGPSSEETTKDVVE